MYSCQSQLQISIHAPAGGATLPVRAPCAGCRFQFTPLREGRPKSLIICNCSIPYFNSRPCGRGDPRDTQVSPLSYEFQFTPLREGRRWTAQSTPILSHFNSRPCGRGDLVRRPHILQPQFISIHAPAGGATDAHALTHTAPPYFNSRPCGRGDQGIPKFHRCHTNFNSRPCGRGDRRARSRARTNSNFNSRPCGRGDGCPTATAARSAYFNSRPCGRGDPCQTLPPPRVYPYFNSRPCGRGDLLHVLHRRSRDISIHAPAGGATIKNRRKFSTKRYFNSRPCGRGDFGILHKGSCFLIFQFTPLREGRPRRNCTRSKKTDFNSRPCGRGDLARCAADPRRKYFNSRPCGRGDIQRCDPAAGHRFQFTPLREGRRTVLPFSLCVKYFNSRPCGRGDEKQEDGNWLESVISIHAPAGGATQFSIFNEVETIFQFTPLREGRLATGISFS